MKKIAFYISGRATRLCEIISDKRYDKLPLSLEFVLTDTEEGSDRIHNLCGLHGIEWISYNYVGLHMAEDRLVRNRRLSDFLLEQLEKREIDYLFLLGHHLLSGLLLDRYRDKIICFHPSLLPHYPGFGAIDQAVSTGDFVVGNSAILIDEGMDTGKVVMQSVTHISNFGEGNYNALLRPIVDMFYYLAEVLAKDKLVILDEGPKILGADYSKVGFWPDITQV